MAQQPDQDCSQVAVEVRFQLVQVAPAVSRYPHVQALVASVAFTLAVGLEIGRVTHGQADVSAEGKASHSSLASRARARAYCAENLVCAFDYIIGDCLF